MNYYRNTPEIRSLADATALVREILSEMKPWPEKVEVGDPDEVKQAGQKVIFSSDEHCTLPLYLEQKLTAIRSEIRHGIALRRAQARMPELAIVIGDAITWIWDYRVGQVLREPGEEAG
jgi:hypothetical protein